MRNLYILFSILFIILFHFNCDPNNDVEMDVKLSSLSPTYMVPNMPNFTLTARGENFKSSSKIVFDSIEQETTFLDSATLTCIIKPEVIWPGSNSVQAGVKSQFSSSTSPVYVVDGSSGSENQSKTIDFEYIESHKFKNTSEVATTSNSGGFPMSVIDSKGNIHIVWGEGVDIYYSQSTDNGESWTAKAKISDHNSTSAWPNITVDEDDFIYVVWNNYLNKTGIYFTKSINDGVSWRVPERIGEGGFPVISSGSTGFLALTYNSVGGNSEVFSTISTNKGNTWATPVQVSYGFGPSVNAEIIVDREGIIYATWKGIYEKKESVFFSYSSNMGGTWASVQRLSNGPSHYSRPVISTDNDGKVYIVWFNLDADRRCFFARSDDKGKTWSPSKIIPSEIYGMDPDIACDPYGNIYLAWRGSDGVYTSRSIDSGDNWSEAVKILSDFGSPDYPEIEVDKFGNVYLFMQYGDYVKNTKILFSKSDSNFLFDVE